MTNTDERPFLQDTTVCVITVGDEPNFTECLQKLRGQTVRFPLEIVDRVAPMSRAFREMQHRCRTPWFVQVDEDMLLYPHAIATLRERITAAPSNVAIVCATLWDCDAEMLLYGVKIYRTSIVEQFPYEDTISCEVDQIKRMKAAGYAVDTCPLDDRTWCLGEHGKHYSPASIFNRWQRLFQKHRALGNSGWVRPYARRLLDRYARTGSTLHLYAALGAIAGITGELPPDRELDFREANAVYERLTTFFPLDK